MFHNHFRNTNQLEASQAARRASDKAYQHEVPIIQSVASH